MSTAPNMHGASAGASAEARCAEIEQLLARGKARRAVDLAKDLHKSRGSPESEALLARAYRARIEEMLHQGLTKDAQALLALVRERYPGSFSACDDQASLMNVVGSGCIACGVFDQRGLERTWIACVVMRHRKCVLTDRDDAEIRVVHKLARYIDTCQHNGRHLDVATGTRMQLCAPHRSRHGCAVACDGVDRCDKRGRVGIG